MPGVSKPQALRERAGLHLHEAAKKMGISVNELCDIENCDDDLTSCYSLVEVARFAKVLGARAVDFFEAEPVEEPISATALVQLITRHCESNAITLEQFEDEVGWRLSACIKPPERLLENISIDGLRWLCGALGIDWRRVISGVQVADLGDAAN